MSAAAPVYCVVIPEPNAAPTTLIYRPEGHIRTYRHGEVDGRAEITSYADTATEAEALLAAGEPFALRTDVAQQLYGWRNFSPTPAG